MAKATAGALRARKSAGPKIAMITAYDCPGGRFVEQGGADIALVGDTLGVVVLGQKDTHGVTMEMIETAIAAVRRGAPQTHIVGDMPIHSYDTPETAVASAQRLVASGADSVKLEGAVIDEVAALRKAGIEVMGHVGLLPQTATSYRARGRDREEADRIVVDAQTLAEADCYALVLEHMPMDLGRRITEAVPVPTIGIGAGPHCDGQVLVMHDMLGFYDRGTGYSPPFVKRYAEVAQIATEACRRYVEEVRSGAFPDESHSTR